MIDPHGLRSLPWLLSSPIRMMAVLVVVLALPMGVLLYVGLNQVQLELMDQAQNETMLAARLAASLVREHLDGSVRFLVSHARSQSFARAVARDDAAAVRERLVDIVIEQRRFNRVVVADVHGTLLYDAPSAPASQGRDLSQSDWFRGVTRERRPYVSALFLRFAPPRQWVVAIAIPVVGPRGETLAYLVGQERATQISAVAASTRPTPLSEVVWVDRTGQAPGTVTSSPTSMLVNSAVRAALGGREVSGLSTESKQGRQMLQGFAPIPRFGGVVIVHRPLAEVLSPIAALRARFLSVALATLVAMLGLSALLFVALERRQAYLLRVEGELRRSRDELEAVSYSLSHDLRTPLRGIDGFAQILLEEQGERLDAASRDHLLRVRQASQRMGQLLDAFVELLAVSRAELRPEPVDLGAVAREVRDRLGAAEPARHVAWAIEEGLVAEGDPRLLRLAVASLLDNAWKFTCGRDPGHIALRRVPGPAGEPSATFVVEDDGAGFDMAYVDKLFQPFEKLHGPREESSGSGMGLAIVRRVIQRHGGRVWAEGAPNRGARFYFALPATRERG